METTKRKHKIYDHPYLGALVSILLIYAAANVVAMFPAIYQEVYGKYILKSDLPAEFLTRMKYINESVSLLTAFVCLWIHKRWFRKDGYKGCFSRPLHQNKDVMILLVGAVVFDLVFSVVGNLYSYGSLTLIAPSFATVLMSLNAGISEEVTFRAIPASIMMKNQPSYKRMLAAVFITSGVFAGVHLGNAFAGASVTASVLQAFSALGSGLFFGAVYIRTGNMLYTMVYHTVHDIIGMMDPEQVTSVITQTSFGMVDCVVTVAVGLIFGAAGLYLLRKSKWEEIKATWANIWAE